MNVLKFYYDYNEFIKYFHLQSINYKGGGGNYVEDYIKEYKPFFNFDIILNKTAKPKPTFSLLLRYYKDFFNNGEIKNIMFDEYKPLILKNECICKILNYSYTIDIYKTQFNNLGIGGLIYSIFTKEFANKIIPFVSFDTKKNQFVYTEVYANFKIEITKIVEHLYKALNYCKKIETALNIDFPQTKKETEPTQTPTQEQEPNPQETGAFKIKAFLIEQMLKNIINYTNKDDETLYKLVGYLLGYKDDYIKRRFKEKINDLKYKGLTGKQLTEFNEVKEILKGLDDMDKKIKFEI